MSTEQIYHEVEHPAGEPYKTLVGPDNFECALTEPEDRIWSRDLKDVVDRLNSQHEEIIYLNEQLKEWRRLRPLASHWIWDDKTTEAQAIIDRITDTEKRFEFSQERERMWENAAQVANRRFTEYKATEEEYDEQILKLAAEVGELKSQLINEKAKTTKEIIDFIKTIGSIDEYGKVSDWWQKQALFWAEQVEQRFCMND